jgi:hypothetical protein
VRADLREATFGGATEAVEHGTGDRELEHAVAEELEPLVGLGAVLRPGGVGEDLLEPVVRQLSDESAELVRPGASTSLSPGVR